MENKGKKRTVWLIAGCCLLAVLFLMAGNYIREYTNSDVYLYRKNMRKADKCFAKEEWYSAYQAYCEARKYEAEDEGATKGMWLSYLGVVKEDRDIDTIIWYYESLFSDQDLFTGEMDISEWYFDCTDYYLKNDDPMGAVDLLERGMETFAKPKTVVEEKLTPMKEKPEQDIREDILEKMQEKKDDILDHCQLEAVTEYSDGERKKYTQYDEMGREILNVDYFYYNTRSEWVYKSYGIDGKVIAEDVWEQEGYTGEKQKTGETIYNEKGNLLSKVEYNRESGEKIYEVNCEYDEKGNEIYYEQFYWEELVCQRECCVLSDTLRIDRVYDTGLKGEGFVYYNEKKWDKNGNLLEDADYLGSSYTLEEIQEGRVPAESRYYYTYDLKGNCLRKECLEESGKYYLTNEWEYDDENNLIKEVRFGYDERGTFKFTTIWHYNKKNLLVERKEQRSEDGKEYPNNEEFYIYDEADRLIRVDYIEDGEFWYSAIKEYDWLGNQIEEYRVYDGEEDVSKEKHLLRKWDYQYHYTGSI